MAADRSSLTIEVRAGDRLSISSAHEILIELIEKSGKQARLRITAPRDVKIEKTAAAQVVASMAT